MKAITIRPHTTEPRPHTTQHTDHTNILSSRLSQETTQGSLNIWCSRYSSVQREDLAEQIILIRAQIFAKYLQKKNVFPFRVATPPIWKSCPSPYSQSR